MQRRLDLLLSPVSVGDFFYVIVYPVGSRFLVSGLHISWQNPKDFGSGKQKTLSLHWSQTHLVGFGNVIKTLGMRAVSGYRSGLVSLG